MPYDDFSGTDPDTHFLRSIGARIDDLPPPKSHVPAAVVLPFDAELFGHWWHEGPAWLEAVLRGLDGSPLRACAPSESRLLTGDLAAARPAASTWGRGGHCAVWMEGEAGSMLPEPTAWRGTWKSCGPVSAAPARRLFEDAPCGRPSAKCCWPRRPTARFFSPRTGRRNRPRAMDRARAPLYVPRQRPADGPRNRGPARYDRDTRRPIFASRMVKRCQRLTFPMDKGLLPWKRISMLRPL